MSTQLPQLAIPTDEIFLPCSNQTVKYRQFLVKEEKLLLMGAEKSANVKDMINVLKQVVQNCTFDKIDITTLPMFDLEYLFLQLRSASIGEELNVNIKCSECSSKNPVSINVKKLVPTQNPEHTNKIVISDNPYVGVCLKYPTIELLEYYDNPSKAFDIILNSIEYIYDQENIMYAKDYSKAQLQEFLEGLDRNQFLKIGQFFETAPRIKQDVEFNCKKCNTHNKYTLKEFTDFFI